MSRSDTWMPLYVGDYLRDTGHLTVAEHGAYLLLLMQAWTSGGTLPTDEMRLRIISKMDVKQWKASSKAVLGFFTQEGESFRHKRLDKELANASAMTEQRRTAGKASAEARKAKREMDGKDNENPTTVETSVRNAVDVSLERISIPSPSQSKEEVASNEATTPQGDLLPHLRPPALAASRPIKPSADPNDPKVILWREGRAILGRLVGKHPDEMNKVLGDFVTKAKGADGVTDHAALTEILRDAERQKPDHPIAWIVGSIKSRAMAAPDPNAAPDPYGIRAWIARQPDVKPGRVNGKESPCINGYGIEATADQIAEHIGLPETWRGNWDAMGAWMREDVPIYDEQVLCAMGDFARSITGNISSIKIFDSIVRGGQRAA